MSMETIFTTQTAKTTQQGAGKTTAGTTGNTVLGGGLSFFNMFLNIEQTGTTSEKITTGDNNMQTSAQKIADIIAHSDVQTSLKKMQDLAAQSGLHTEVTATTDNALNAAILATSEAVREDLELIENPTLQDVLSLNAIDFDKQLITTDTDGEIGLNGDDKLPEILESLGIDTQKDFIPGLKKLEKILAKIETMIENESPALIVTNFTPETISAMRDQLEAIQNGETKETGNEEIAGFAFALIKMLPPQAKPMVIATGRSLVISPKQLEVLQSKDGALKASNDLGGKANALSTLTQPIMEDGELVFFDDDASLENNFKKLLGEFIKGGKDSIAGKGSTQGIDNNAAASNGGNGTPPAHVLRGWPFGNSGTLFSAMEFSTGQMEELGLTTGSTPISTNSAFTSVVTQSQSAGHPHPATNMVAATIKKVASGGESKDIRIDLDPPELGRVEIKMSFNKDKTMKAVLTAEKPETFMMLQRDAQILERALQESGLDISADGALSFELADDGNFGSDGGHDGSRNQAGNGNADGDAEEIIETTMTWHVDPETGHMRYNILA